MASASILLSLVLAAPAPGEEKPAAPASDLVTRANLRSKYLSPDGSVQIVLGSEGMVEFVETRTNKSRTVQIVHAYFDAAGMLQQFPHVGAAAVAPRSPHVALLNHGGKIEVRNWRTGDLVSEIALAARTVERLGVGSAEMAFSGDESHLAVCFYEQGEALGPWGHGLVIDMNKEIEKRQVPGLFGVAAVADGRLLGAMQDEMRETMTVWDLVKNERVRYLGDKHTEQYHRAAFSPDGRFLAAAGADKTFLRVWSIETGKEVMAQPLGESEVGRGLAISAGNRFVVLTATDREKGADALVRVWNLSTGKLAWSKREPLHLAGDPVLLPDATHVAVGLKDLRREGERERFAIWNLAAGEASP